jgi:tripartite-type tricarboxylate transporter receptor subunit TctC
MGQYLSDRLGKPFIIENRPGGGTNIGTEAVVRALPDGHTLLLATTANAINASLYDKLNFDFIRDIAPVAGIMRVPIVMVVNSSFPSKRFLNSSPTPRAIQAKSIWRQTATEPPSMWSASCSR